MIHRLENKASEDNKDYFFRLRMQLEYIEMIGCRLKTKNQGFRHSNLEGVKFVSLTYARIMAQLSKGDEKSVSLNTYMNKVIETCKSQMLEDIDGASSTVDSNYKKPLL